MLHVGFARIRPERESRLRAWLAELGTRRSEVIETFQQETVRHEQVFIVPGEGGPLLVYVVVADDLTHAATVYKRSSLAIDEEHRAVLEDCLLERLKIEPLFHCAVETRS